MELMKTFVPVVKQLRKPIDHSSELPKGINFAAPLILS